MRLAVSTTRARKIGVGYKRVDTPYTVMTIIVVAWPPVVLLCKDD
jgi:hypothetical protein